MQKYKGIQVEYALCLRQVQIIVYHKQANPKKYSVRNVQDMGNILTHMYQQGIYCRSDFNDRINKERENYERAKAELERMEKQIASVQKTADDCTVFSAINKKIPDVTEEDRQEYRRTAYCRQYDSENILRQLSELKQKQNSLIAEYESAKQQLSQSEKIASQYDRYMADDYSKIVEQVRAERQASLEAEQPKEVNQGRNVGVGYCGR
jgi:DNA repair exonuclease SbcCD ATPase subunit